MSAQHTPGPWRFIEASQTIVSNQSHPIARLSEPFHRQVRGGTGNDGPLIAASPELLAELQKAHQIILNALALMTFEQKGEWARSNHRDGVIGDGTTRFHERAEAIAKATGSAA